MIKGNYEVTIRNKLTDKKVVYENLALQGVIDENIGLFGIENISGTPHTFLLEPYTEEDLNEICQTLNIDVVKFAVKNSEGQSGDCGEQSTTSK